jgi:flagellar capping protein FliD
METIKVELKLAREIDIDVRLDDVIDGINDCQMKRRWNYIAKIINGVQLNLSDLTEEQEAIIKKYLTDKLSLF